MPRGHRRGPRGFSNASLPVTARPRTSTRCSRLAENMTGKTICVLSDSCATPVAAGLQKFRGDFEALDQEEEASPRAGGGINVTDDSRSDPERREEPLAIRRDLSFAALPQDDSMSETINLTIEGRQVSVPAGTSILEAAKYRRGAHSALLLPPGTACGGRLPHVSGGSREDAKAGAVVRHGRQRKGRWCTCTPRRRSRRARACSRCCSSITRSTARSATRRASASCRTTRIRKDAPKARLREPKRFNPAEDFGGDVMYVPNRCILCTRCVRFMDDVAHDPVLECQRARRPRLIGKFEGEGPDARLGRERHRPLPGRRAALQGLAQQGARLGA